MSIASRVRAVLPLLPDWIARPILRAHYARVVRDFDVNDEPDLPIARRMVRPGDVIVDVGANIGIYTRFLSEAVGPGGRVYAIEPVPLTFDLLSHDIRRLGLANVDAISVAVCDQMGPVQMSIPSLASGGRNLYRAKIQPDGDGIQRFTVAGTTLDHLFAGREQPIRLVKIDVEGAEGAVIRGAERLLGRFHPVLLIEVNSDPDDLRSEASEIFRILERHGYTAFRGEGGRLVPRRPGDVSVNYFFLPRGEEAPRR